MKQEQQSRRHARLARRRSWLLVAMLVCTALSLPMPARAIDIAPGDYGVLPDGTILGLTYFQYSTSDQLSSAQLSSAQLSSAQLS